LNGTTTGNGAIWSQGGAAGGGYSGPVTLNADNALGGGSDFFIAGKISGTGGLIKLGAATITCSNSANNYSGGTTLSAGTLHSGLPDVIPDTGPMQVNATWSLANNSDFVGSLSGNAAGNIQLGFAQLRVTQTTDGTYAGAISGQGNFVKNGSAT